MRNCLLLAAALALVGCSAANEPSSLVAVETASAGARVRLSLQGVPVAGLEGRRPAAGAAARFPSFRYAPDLEPLTTARVSNAEACATVRARLPGPVEPIADELVLVPREELRPRVGAPTGRPPNAEDYERVVTGLDLVVRCVVATRTAAPHSERHWVGIVDAVTGRLVSVEPLAVEAYVTVDTWGFYSGTQHPLVAYDADLGYSLEDTNGNLIFGESSPNPLTPVNYYSDDNQFGDGHLYDPSNGVRSANAETAAVDALDAVRLTWLMFGVVLSRLGPNNHNEPESIIVHDANVNGEFRPVGKTVLLGYASLTPDPVTHVLRPMTSTDITAHELGHDFFVSAVYPDWLHNHFENHTEIAGISEGTADIIGFLTELYRDASRSQPPVSIDAYVLRDSNLTIGEQVAAGVTRSLIAPQRQVWAPDLGGLDQHIAAGPIDRVFLLIAYGCRPPPPQVYGAPPFPWSCDGVAHSQGIGPTAAGKLWQCMVDQLPPGSLFTDVRDVLLACAVAQDGHWGGLQTVAVADAFAGIHVGSPADFKPPSLTLSCQQIPHGIRCTGQVTDAENPDSFTQSPQLTVDGGAPVPTNSWNFTTDLSDQGLAAGGHLIVLTAWDQWMNQAQTSLVLLLDRTPPTATLTRSGPIKQPLFSVTASDVSGLSRTELRDGTSLIAADYQPPVFDFPLDTSTWADGIHNLTFSVYDSFDNVKTLPYALAVDNTAPAVTLAVSGSAPPYNVSVTATDASAIVQADFKVDGVVFAHISGPPPYQTTYSPADPLAHNLIVAVTDAFGNVGTASRAAPLDHTPPAVSFLAEQANLVVSLQGSVADSCGIHYPYTLVVDGTVLAQPTTPNFYYLLAPTLPTGEHAFQAIVSDNCGNTTNFVAPFTKIVTPPILSVVSRDDSHPKQPTFTLSCVDADGVERVVARKNGVEIASVTTEPYEITIDTSMWPDGDSQIEFQCYDIYQVPSSPQYATVTADNTGPGFTFSLWGAGAQYTAILGSVGDFHGIAEVLLDCGFGLSPCTVATETAPPWGYTFSFGRVTVRQVNFPFDVSATDTWGNVTSKEYLCNVDTTIMQGRWISCVAGTPPKRLPRRFRRPRPRWGGPSAPSRRARGRNIRQ